MFIQAYRLASSHSHCEAQHRVYAMLLTYIMNDLQNNGYPHDILNVSGRCASLIAKSSFTMSLISASDKTAADKGE
jgi:hypothetical protein